MGDSSSSPNLGMPPHTSNEYVEIDGYAQDEPSLIHTISRSWCQVYVCVCGNSCGGKEILWIEKTLGLVTNKT